MQSLRLPWARMAPYPKPGYGPQVALSRHAEPLGKFRRKALGGSISRLPIASHFFSLGDLCGGHLFGDNIQSLFRLTSAPPPLE